MLLAVLGVAAGSAFVVAAVAAQPAGDQQASTFFNRMVSDYALVPGAKVVETGYFSLRSNGGTSVSYRWGAPTPKGYVPATATILEWLSNGKITAYLATVTAHGVHRLQILMAGGQVFLSTARCWSNAAATSSPFGTGVTSIFNTTVKFLPLVKTPTSTVVTYTIPWRAGTTAREVDRFTNGVPPAISTVITITGKEAFTIHESTTPLKTAPALPVNPPPALPAPKPHCKPS